jgi:hypothetical protein
LIFCVSAGLNFGKHLDCSTRRSFINFGGSKIRTFESAMSPLAIAPDGRTALSGSGSPDGNTLKLWDLT